MKGDFEEEVNKVVRAYVNRLKEFKALKGWGKEGMQEKMQKYTENRNKVYEDLHEKEKDALDKVMREREMYAKRKAIRWDQEEWLHAVKTGGHLTRSDWQKIEFFVRHCERWYAALWKKQHRRQRTLQKSCQT